MVVYLLADPASLEVRYVGETKRRLISRLRQHMRTAKEKTTPPVNAWIRGLINSGAEPVAIEIESYSTDEERFAGEVYWIEQMKAIGANLLNIAPGGSTRVGYRHSEETKQRWRENRRGENCPMYGKRRTEAQKAMFREIAQGVWDRHPHPNLGKKRSPETIEKLRLARKGKKWSKQQRQRWEETMRRKAAAKMEGV